MTRRQMLSLFVVAPFVKKLPPVPHGILVRPTIWQNLQAEGLTDYYVTGILRQKESTFTMKFLKEPGVFVDVDVVDGSNYR